MLNLKSQVFEPESGLINQRSFAFSKTWSGGGVFGVIHLEDDKLDLAKIGNYLSQSLLDLIMNSTEEDRIKLLNSILLQMKDSCKTVFVTEGSLYTEGHSMRACILMFLGKNVYIGLGGKSGCYLRKNDKVLGFSDLVEDDEIKVVSGNFSETDLFLLSSDAKLSLKTGFENSLHQILANYSVVVGEEKILEEFVQLAENLRDIGIDSETEKVENSDNEENKVAVEEVTESIATNDKHNEEVFEETDDLLEEVYEESDDLATNNANEWFSQARDLLVRVVNVFQTNVFPIIRKVVLKILQISGSLGTWIIETIVGFGGRSKYQTESLQKLKIRRILLIVFIIFFSLGLYLSVRWIKTENAQKELQEQYSVEYARLESSLKEAESMASYNSGESRIILSNIISDAEKLADFAVESNNANDLVSGAKRIVDQIEKRTRLTDPNVIADLKIEHENAEPDDLLLFDNNLWVTDPGASVVYKVSIVDGTSIVAFDRSDGLKKPIYLESFKDVLYIYDLDLGLFSAKKAEDNTYTLNPVTGLNPTTLGDVVEMAVYENDGSLYFLVSNENKVKKSVPVGSGFAYPQVRAEDPSFASAEDIGITHVIYTIGDGGELIRYEDNIEIDEAVGDLVDTAKFDLFAYSYVVILDRSERRVVLLKQPEGGSVLFKMFKQFTIQDGEERFLNDLKEVVVDVANNAVYILDGFRIIKINIDE